MIDHRRQNKEKFICEEPQLFDCTYVVDAFWCIVWINYAYVVKTLQFTHLSTTHWKRVVRTDTKMLKNAYSDACLSQWCKFIMYKCTDEAAC